jgi:hypothetical protein
VDQVVSDLRKIIRITHAVIVLRYALTLCNQKCAVCDDTGAYFATTSLSRNGGRYCPVKLPLAFATLSDLQRR